MTVRHWIRRPPEPRERATTAAVTVAVAVATGFVTWYLTSTLLSREPISLRPEEGGDRLDSGEGRARLGE